MWGGFAVDNATLTRFFALHFMLPFTILAFSALHILFLHETGSNNPLGVNRDRDKISFHSYYTFKDVVGFAGLAFLLLLLLFFNPLVLNDPENFISADPLVTPVHIQPEWYFLFAYAILRSIPNKLGGVIGLVASVLILFIVPLVHVGKFQGIRFYPANQILFWFLVGVLLVLTWIGACPVEHPYDLIGQVFTVLYFLYFAVSPALQLIWDKILRN